MKVVDILYVSYYDFGKNEFKIGGVQTYITMLCEIITGLGWEVRVFQQDTIEKTKKIQPNVEVISVDLKKFKKQKKKNNALFEFVKKNRCADKEYLTMFATNNIIPSYPVKKGIAIQHGIYWDIPSKRNYSLLRELVTRMKTTITIIKGIHNIEKLVCVDYNFINWYRTQILKPKVEMVAIPNFSEICEDTQKPDNCINIIFARRFFYYRGTRIFVEVTEKLLENYKNINITVAGEGADEGYIREHLEKFPNVLITKYESQESLKIHSEQHIAVIPTIGSEGTSLSLLEAMSAQCAVVCTNVGGMTNIILDGYNGLMVSPNAEDVYAAIASLLEDEALRKKISANARDTVLSAFSYEKWKLDWEKVLRGL